MRKIEAKMVEKVLAGENWQGGHLTVRTSSLELSPDLLIGLVKQFPIVEIYSYSEKIGEYSPSENTLTLFPPNFRSATTKSHMNALLQGLGVPHSIRQVKGSWVVYYPVSGNSLSFDSNFIFGVKSLQSVH